MACGDAKQQYELALTAFDGIARLHINEAGDSGKKRFQVPHALLPGLDKQAINWDKHDKSPSSLTLKLGQADVTLQYSPLQLDVTVDGKPAISFNSKQLFNFEHLRQKQVGHAEPYHMGLPSMCCPCCAMQPDLAGMAVAMWRGAWGCVHKVLAK